jgi:hypothetical protein
MGITINTRNTVTDIIPLIVDMARATMAMAAVDPATVVTDTNRTVPAMAVTVADPDTAETNINQSINISAKTRKQWRCKSKRGF